jgi:thymidylate kinase
MRLVCIVGIDGAGKTTLARSLVTALQQQGEPAVYLYGKTWPAISRLLMSLGRVVLLGSHDIWQDHDLYTSSKKQTMRSPLLSGLYTVAIWLDYYSQIWVKLAPHLFSQRTVVADRYVYDVVIGDLAVHLNYSLAKADRVIDRALRLLPRPGVTILLDLPEEVAFLRRSDVPHVNYLRERRPWYVRLAGRPEVWRLNGETSSGELLKRVLERIDHGKGGGMAP